MIDGGTRIKTIVHGEDAVALLLQERSKILPLLRIGPRTMNKNNRVRVLLGQFTTRGTNFRDSAVNTGIRDLSILRIGIGPGLTCGNASRFAGLRK